MAPDGDPTPLLLCGRLTDTDAVHICT